MNSKIINTILWSVLSLVLLTVYFGISYREDHVELSQEVGVDGGTTSVSFTSYLTKTLSLGVVQYISRCKKIPDNILDLNYQANDDSINYSCKKVPIDNSELKRNFYDPWGRPYQIRYDLERGKLQVRSQGRYLWWPWDDIVGETPFVTKDYPKDGLPLYVEMLEHCKKVPKDDMSCIFNRGWH